VLEPLSMQAKASGGSSDTAQKALTVRPRGRASWPKAVRTTTPLGKLAMTFRNLSGWSIRLILLIVLGRRIPHSPGDAGFNLLGSRIRPAHAGIKMSEAA
jgi:hypothetical protein